MSSYSTTFKISLMSDDPYIFKPMLKNLFILSEKYLSNILCTVPPSVK